MDRLLKNKYVKTGAVMGCILLFVLEFFYQRKIVFIMDDLWYATNLVTGEPLSGIRDVIQSQVWHFLNWGGRNITHGILQLTLLSGELAADMINLAMTALLGIMICKLSGLKSWIAFFLSEVMLVFFNPNLRQSMFWQSGVVNYVYSTVWILLFLWTYFRELEEDGHKDLKFCAVWILPIGLMTGWSNENMGPASAVMAIATVGYLYFIKKRKINAWMIEGIVTSVIGSILVIVAPGNFVRVGNIEKTPLTVSVYNRLLSMLTATAEYLFPVLICLFISLAVYKGLYHKKFTIKQLFMLIMVPLAHGAMILSPHYPDRATFGIMVLCISCILEIWKEILNEESLNVKLMVGVGGIECLCSIFIMLQHIVFG